MAVPEITADRLVLAAIVQTLKPKQREHLLRLIGEVQADNIVRLRQPVSTPERNALVRDARFIAGER